MKWFKHYTDASFDSKIAEVEQEYGLTGYAVYFKIIEICALQWDGKTNPKFKLNRKKTKSILSLNYKKTESILSLFSVLNLFNVEITENFYIIEIPNLLKIKDNHTKNLQVDGNKVSRKLPQEQNRTDKNRTDKNIYTPDDLITLYNKNFGSEFGNCVTLGNKTHVENFQTCKENGLHSQEKWQELFDLCKNSDYLMGKENDWHINLTWLLNFDNAAKVLNGNYKNKKQTKLTWNPSDDVLRACGEIE